MNLEKRVEEWVREGVLERSHADAILRYEAKTLRHSWAMYSVAGVGVLALMSGVVSIIAANWEAFSYLGKLIGYFLVLAGIGALCVRKANRPGLGREVLLTIFCLFVLAGIGLIGQMFNLQGDGWQAVAFWLLITLPAVLLAESKLLPNIWFLGFYSALGLWIFAAWKVDVGTARLMWAIAGMYLSLAFSFALADRIPLRFVQAARSWAILIGLLGGGSFVNAAWEFGTHDLPRIHGLPVGVAIFTCVLAAAAMIFRAKEFPHGAAKVGALTVLASGLTIFPPLTTPITPNEFIGCILFLLPWCGVAIAAALASRKRLFDIAMFIIGSRIVTVYFEVLGSLAATGIGLILSGALILGVVYLWHKYRAQLAEMIRERL